MGRARTERDARRRIGSERERKLDSVRGSERVAGGRVRGSIESPLRRASAGVARWNHAAAGGLFSVYICRSITLDPVGCRPLSRRVRCSGKESAGTGDRGRVGGRGESRKQWVSCGALRDSPKICGEFAPSTGYHFSSGVARLDKC